MNKIYIGFVILFLGVFGFPGFTFVVSVPAQEPFRTYRTFTSWEDEKVDLLNFGIYLTKNPNMTGFIVFYIGKKDSKSAVNKRINKSKTYLIKIANLDPSRLKIICGGRGDNLSQTVLNMNDKSLSPPDFGSGQGCRKHVPPN